MTKFEYYSWNCLTQIVYPDQEKITYSYNQSGLLNHIKGSKAYSYDYVNKIGYNKFEQKIYMKYYNGAETNYAYNPLRRRLENLKVTSYKTNA